LETAYDFSEFSCLHAYTVFTDGNATRNLALKYNIPYVVAVRNTDVNSFFKTMPHLRKIGISVLKDAKSIFFLSEAYKKEVFDKYVPDDVYDILLKKSFVIPNGIDDFWHTHEFTERNLAATEMRIAQKKLNIIYAGGIDKNKNLTETNMAVNILKNRGWNIEYHVVGKIKDQQVYDAIKDSIYYHEAMPKEKLIDLYRAADLFVMPSHTESFGLVYVEAMSQGLPVIYTRGQGFDGHFAEGEVGYSVSDSDAEELSIVIEKCADRYREISEKCVIASRKFSWKRICERYIEIYGD